MDHFGIGAAMRGMAMTYINTACRTGRTTSLIESLKDGDRVLCMTAREAKRIERLCRERDLQVTTIVVPVRDPQKAFWAGTAQGRAIFDHTWIEQYYLAALEHATSEIDMLQQQLSGYGTAHIETKRKALELAKWRI